ncbi:hypothetical protein D8674_024420 [Pyrus ussuriensis x Pyrus communis]|uniref:Uncharacterized protein n=1 Tax=Pyrus ussuriensis x Pyrus communis TaxID=2448454 RepID=A0A5N5H3T0_9ROSA|nr:hypothetical protein D8674_024420 [Pyrus ussuriensis x Pyrus communis]
MKAGLERQQIDKEVFAKILEQLKSSVGQAPAPSSSSIPLAMVVTPTSQFNLTTGEMLHFVEDDNAFFLRYQLSKRRLVLGLFMLLFRQQHILLPKFMAYLRYKHTCVDVAAESSISIPTKVTTATAAFGGTGMMPHHLASFPTMASLPELVKKFGQIRGRS